MLPEKIGDDACGLSRRWKLDPLLASMFVALALKAQDAFSAAGVRWDGLYIISGWRSRAKQARVNPLAPQSRHTYCPSLAGDLRVANLPASTTPIEVWAILGGLWKQLGGRWGGDFKTPDYNHFELITVTGGPVANREGVTPVLIAPKPVSRAAPRVPLRPQIRSRPLLG